MMQEYGQFLEQFRNGTQAVIESGANLSRLGISYFVLREQATTSSLRVWGWMGIYPTEESSDSTFLAAASDPTKDFDSFQTITLSLRLPERIRKMHIPEDPNRANALERALAKYHIPTKLLVIGEFAQTQEEALALYCALGIRPAKALREIQARLRQKLTEDRN